MRLGYINGKFGRVKSTINGVPELAEAPRADQRGELYVSQSTILEDQRRLEEEKKLKAEIKKARAAKIKEDAKQFVKEFNHARAFQLQERKNKKISPEELKMKHYFSQQMGMTETEKVARSIKADFNINAQSIETNPLRPIVKRADFNQFQLRGNPLTRDGIQGHVTDYERIVSGGELDNDHVGNVVGGTMLRSVNQMGFSFSELWDKATDELQTQAEARIETEVKNWLNPTPTTQPIQTVTTVRPALPSSNTIISGVPNAVVYGAAALGVLGLGLLLLKKRG